MTSNNALNWSRHLPTCTGVTRTGKPCAKCNGSGPIAQRNVYATDVAVAMVGPHTCPACMRDTRGVQTDVDKVIPALGYVPQNVVRVCRPCNESRGILQSLGRDWTHVEAYAADVRAASESVTILSVADARRAWSDRPEEDGPVSRYA